MKSQCLDMGYEGVILYVILMAFIKKAVSDSKMQCWRIQAIHRRRSSQLRFLKAHKNNNERKSTKLGRTERSSHQENMQPNGEVVQLSIGTTERYFFTPFTGNVLFKEGLEVQVSPRNDTR